MSPLWLCAALLAVQEGGAPGDSQEPPEPAAAGKRAARRGADLVERNLADTPVTAAQLLKHAVQPQGAARAADALAELLAELAPRELILTQSVAPPLEPWLRKGRTEMRRNLEKMGVGPIEVQGILALEERRVLHEAVNVVVPVPGTTPRTLVVAVPLDGPGASPDGSGDWPSCALAGCLYAAFRDAPLRHTLLLVGLGAEASECRGSAHFMASYPALYGDPIDAVIFLEGLGRGAPSVWVGASAPAATVVARAVSRQKGIALGFHDYVDLDPRHGSAAVFRNASVPTLVIEGTRLALGGAAERAAPALQVDPRGFADAFRLVVEVIRALDSCDAPVTVRSLEKELRPTREDWQYPVTAWRLLEESGPRLLGHRFALPDATPLAQAVAPSAPGAKSAGTPASSRSDAAPKRGSSRKGKGKGKSPIKSDQALEQRAASPARNRDHPAAPEGARPAADPPAEPAKDGGPHAPFSGS